MKFVLKRRQPAEGARACSDHYLCVRDSGGDERVAVISGMRGARNGRRSWSVTMIGFHYRKEHCTLKAARADAEKTFTRWRRGKKIYS